MVLETWKRWKIKSVHVFPRDWRHWSEFCGSFPFARSQSRCSFVEHERFYQAQFLPSGLFLLFIILKEKKKKITLRQNVKNTQTPKITGRDSKSNYFYCSSQARILLLLCRLRYLSTWLKPILFFWLQCPQNYKSMSKTEDAALQQGRKTSIKQASRFWSKSLECWRGRGIRSWSHNQQSFCQIGMRTGEIQQQSSGKKGQ